MTILIGLLGLAAAAGWLVRRRGPNRRLRRLRLARPDLDATAGPAEVRVPARRPAPWLARGHSVWQELRAAGRRRTAGDRLLVELPFAAELFAAVLRAGMPPDAAALACGGAIGGELGGLFTRAGRALRLGAEPADAWQYLAGLPAARSLVRLLVRSADNGTSCAAAAVQLAQELRAAAQQAELARARRAGVLVVLPLGLCFLPAFVLAGVVPVVAAVLRGALR